MQLDVDVMSAVAQNPRESGDICPRRQERTGHFSKLQERMKGRKNDDKDAHQGRSKNQILHGRQQDYAGARPENTTKDCEIMKKLQSSDWES